MKKKTAIFLCILMAAMIISSIIILVSLGKQKKDDEQDPEQNIQTEEQDESASYQEEEQEEDYIVDSSNELDNEEEEEQEDLVIDESEYPSVWVVSDVNFRAEANTECEVLTVVRKGDELKKLGEVDGWYYVKFGEYVGYVSTDYLTDEDPSEVSEESEEPLETSKIEVLPRPA